MCGGGSEQESVDGSLGWRGGKLYSHLAPCGALNGELMV